MESLFRPVPLENAPTLTLPPVQKFQRSLSIHESPIASTSQQADLRERLAELNVGSRPFTLKVVPVSPPFTRSRLRLTSTNRLDAPMLEESAEIRPGELEEA